MSSVTRSLMDTERTTSPQLAETQMFGRIELELMSKTVVKFSLGNILSCLEHNIHYRTEQSKQKFHTLVKCGSLMRNT